MLKKYKYDVFFYEAFEEEEKELKKNLPKQIKAGFTWKTIQEYDSENIPATIISLRTQSRIPNSWGKTLEAILSRSTGYDHLLKYQAESGTKCQTGYLPLYCNRAVAEQALTIWMALLRKLPRQIHNFKTFCRDGLTGQETRGKTLLVVGVGNIGSEVIKIGNGLGMTVYGVDLIEKYDFANYVNIEEGLSRADIIVCAMNLTASNVNYFSADRLRQARPGVVFVNIARGELSHSEGLLQLIKDGHLGGLGLDVYNQESDLANQLRTKSQQPGNPETAAILSLAKHENVILTPHNSFNTKEAVIKKSFQSIEQIVCFMQNGSFKWPTPKE